MKQIDISTPKHPNTFAMVDNEAHCRVSRTNFYARGKDSNHLYACSSFWAFGKYIHISMHRVIMRAGKGQVVDHINHDTLDNRKANLRVCTSQQNVQNQLRSSRNTSGYKGVSRSMDGKWCAQINKKEGPRVASRIGTYDNKEDAATAYDLAAVENYGEFALLNEVDYTKQFQPEIDIDLYFDAIQSSTVLSSEQENILRASFKCLSYIEREILNLRYGIGDGQTYKLREIGGIFNITGERTRQIQANAIAKIKEFLVSKGWFEI